MVMRVTMALWGRRLAPRTLQDRSFDEPVGLDPMIQFRPMRRAARPDRGVACS